MRNRYGCTTVNWEAVRKKAAGEEWAAQAAAKIRREFDDFRREWDADPPLEESDWSHYYFCSACGSRLDFRLDQPRRHACPGCGRVYSGAPYDGAWVSLAHVEIAGNLERAAFLANLYPDKPDFREFIRRYILFYVRHYDRYPVHGSHAGKGKICSQCLTEAIFVIQMERVLRLTAGLAIFTAEEMELVGRLFFRPAAELLKPQVSQIHNIHAWMGGALAAAAHFLGDRELFDFAVDGEFGWRNQVRKGVADDGIWYEISPTYHFYTIHALLSTVWIARENGLDLASEPKFRKMGVTVASLAYDTGWLPAYNDGWFQTRLSEYADIYEQLLSLTGDKEDASVLGRIYRETPRDSMEALLYGPDRLPPPDPPVQVSRIFSSSGIAVLQNDRLRVALKCTPACGGHDHCDKLAVDLFAGGKLLSYDPGTSGYGIGMTAKWSRTSPAHNLIVIDGKRQQSCDGSITRYDGRQVTADAGGAYDGVKLRRTLTLRADGFDDLADVSAARQSTVDWVFHCLGTIESRLPFAVTEPFAMENGYDQLTELKKVRMDDDWSIQWRYGDTVLRLAMEGEPGTEVYIGRCCGWNALEKPGIVIVRRKALRTSFHAEFSLPGG